MCAPHAQQRKRSRSKRSKRASGRGLSASVQAVAFRAQKSRRLHARALANVRKEACCGSGLFSTQSEPGVGPCGEPGARVARAN